MVKFGVTKSVDHQLFSCRSLLDGIASCDQSLSPKVRDGMCVHINLIVFPKFKCHFDTRIQSDSGNCEKTWNCVSVRTFLWLSKWISTTLITKYYRCRRDGSRRKEAGLQGNTARVRRGPLTCFPDWFCCRGPTCMRV
jgi:hypothetical protein